MNTPLPSVFRSNRQAITMRSILAEHELNTAVAIEAAHDDTVTRLDLRRAAAIAKLGRHYQMHPETTFHWESEPVVLKKWLGKQGMQAMHRAGVIRLDS